MFKGTLNRDHCDTYVQGKAKKEPAAKETPVLASMVAHMVTGVQVSDVKSVCKVQIDQNRLFLKFLTHPMENAFR